MRYKAIVSYDGTNYAGWQIQDDQPSIQEQLNKAISKIANEEIKVTGSGRTDSKVHALGQVFHFDCNKNIKDFVGAINSQLPKDIYVIKVEKVADDFHARFSACYKHYDFVINDGLYNPLERNYCQFVRRRLKEEKMIEAAKLLIGKHDFTSFNSTPLEQQPDQVREIYKIDIVRQNDKLVLSFYGNGFLRYMVRTLSAVLINVGLGKISYNDVKNMLETKDKTVCSYNGEPQGLYLVEVGYEPFEK